MSNNTCEESTRSSPAVRDNYTAKDVLYWSYEEASTFSGLSVTTLYSYASLGKFSVRKRGQYKVDRVSFERYLTGHDHA